MANRGAALVYLAPSYSLRVKQFLFANGVQNQNVDISRFRYGLYSQHLAEDPTGYRKKYDRVSRNGARWLDGRPAGKAAEFLGYTSSVLHAIRKYFAGGPIPNRYPRA